MTPADTLLAVAAVTAGVVCAVVALRMTSGVGRLGLLLVLLLTVLVCLGVDLPSLAGRFSKSIRNYQSRREQTSWRVRSLAS